MKIGIAGTGRMGTAIVQRLLESAMKSAFGIAVSTTRTRHVRRERYGPPRSASW